MAHALILAAGLGKRLRPLTELLPKPLLPVGDRPALAHVVARLSAAGFAEATLNTHWLGEAFDGIEGALGIPVRCVHEPAILGTAGGVANMVRARGLEGDVLAWNGDILIDVDARALASAQASTDAIATLAVAPRPLGEGTVGVDARGAVVRLRGERFGVEARGGDFVGVQAIGGATIADLPREGCLVGDVYLPALRRGARVATFEAPPEWDDIGSIDTYLDANLRWLRARERNELVGAETRVDGGVRLVEAIVGRGASVRGEGVLRRVVVWPNAEAIAPLEDAVVTARGVTPGRRTRP